MSELGLPQTRYVFDKLPDGLKLARLLPGQGAKGQQAMIECSHPQQFRFEMTAGAKRGHEICLICKGTDFSRTCLTVVMMADSWKPPANVKGERLDRPEPPAQESLF